MALLLDTHALIWHAFQDERLPGEVRRRVDRAEEAVFVSAVSAWEIATKARRGTLPAGALATDFVAVTRGAGFRILPIGAQDAQDAGSLPEVHRDPFDRMLVGQARRRGLVLVSNEKIFDQYDVQRLWS